MKRKGLLVIAVLMLFYSGYAQETKLLSANEVIKEAVAQAKNDNKNVFIIFHASWCTWCHKMDTAMNNPACKEFFTDNYVIRHLVVREQNKELENPGATELLAKYQGDKGGIPFFVVLDQKGALIADSQIRPEGAGIYSPGRNMGFPGGPQALPHFEKLLKNTSSLTEEEINIIKEVFQKARGSVKIINHIVIDKK
ncbi:MAG: thioredoxin family protein [Bacteroidales bacterium]|nr:thioredoxin family protein [Bacteroidales bacterium]MDD3990069.1 thioredoxin family protein [Bacteroidales bacterium]